MKKKNPKEFREYLLPQFLEIGYQKIKISEYDFTDAQGVYRAEQSEIRIREGTEGRELLNTILHEVLHSIVYVYGMKKDFKDDDDEEKIINGLANGLTEAMLRNPSIVKIVNKTV